MFRTIPMPSNLAQTVYAVALLSLFFLISPVIAHAGQVTLGWNSSPSPATGYNVYVRQQNGSYPTTPQQQTSGTTATVPNLTDGAKYYFIVKAYDKDGNLSGPSNEVSTTVGTTPTTPPPSSGALPSPWLNMDIGNVGSTGNTSYANATFTLRNSGHDIWKYDDAFHFVFQPLHGNGSIVARVASLTNTHAYAKAGVMIRENLDSNARHALVNVTPAGGIQFVRRVTTGSTSYYTQGRSVAAPYWVKLIRSGNTFTAQQSADGRRWRTISSTTINMADDVYVGLAVTSHDNTQINTATFTNVISSITP